MVIPAPPRRRALLPRNPTPWTAPRGADPLPPQVQRLLQQLGAGQSYRTYQPFTVGLPLILPENNPVPSFGDHQAAVELTPQQITFGGETEVASASNNQSDVQLIPIHNSSSEPVNNSSNIQGAGLAQPNTPLPAGQAPHAAQRTALHTVSSGGGAAQRWAIVRYI